MSAQDIHQGFRLNGKTFSSVKELITYTEAIDDIAANFLVEWFNEEDHVFVQTSGSTGTPKQIALLKQHMVNSAKATGTFFDLEEGTTALLCMPAAYIAGKMMLVRALVLGWNLDLIAPNSNPLETTEKSYDFSAFVPLQLYKSLPYIYKVKKLIVGGGVVTQEFISKIQEVPTQIYATYGMTETITHIAVKKLNHTGNNTIENYRTLPDVYITTDERGCLVIEAPKVSAVKVTTNDVVTIHTKETFQWLGRYDNVINSGGVKLHPEKIESKLERYISSRFFVTGIPDDILGEKLILIIEGKKESLDRNIIAKALEKYEIPKAIYYIKEFVETPTGKIQRSKTLEQLG